MPYYGPSKGCETCRARKIGCDQRKPKCLKCEKSNLECAGYRDLFSCMHRDDTSKVRRQVFKFKGRHLTDTGVTVPVHIKGSQGGSGGMYVCENNMLGVGLQLGPTLLQQADMYFKANFILEPLDKKKPYLHGYLDFLPSLLNAAPAGSPLCHAYNAVSLAALGNRRLRADGGKIDQLAMLEHSNALTSLRATLGRAQHVPNEQVLAVILLLVLYENVVSSAEVQIQNLRHHVHAAVEIIRMRGAEMLCTRTGRLLFNAVRFQLISNMLSRGLAPDSDVDWWAAADPHSITTQCQRFCFKTAELSSRVGHEIAQSRNDRSNSIKIDLMYELIRHAQALDDKIVCWLDGLSRNPLESGFRPLCYVHLEDDSHLVKRPGLLLGRDSNDDGYFFSLDAFPGSVDEYPDVTTASVWNMARVARIILGSLVVRLAAWVSHPLDYRETAEYRSTLGMCEDNIAGIIASVPYHLGWRKNRYRAFVEVCSRRRWRRQWGRESDDDVCGAEPAVIVTDAECEAEAGTWRSESAFLCGEDASPEMPKALPALFAIWPLTAVQNHDMTTKEQRAWVKGRLKFIAEEIGLKHAELLSRSELRFPSMMIHIDNLGGCVNLSKVHEMPLRQRKPGVAT